jgi:PKD repeat protein
MSYSLTMRARWVGGGVMVDDLLEWPQLRTVPIWPNLTPSNWTVLYSPPWGVSASPYPAKLPMPVDGFIWRIHAPDSVDVARPWLGTVLASNTTPGAWVVGNMRAQTEFMHTPNQGDFDLYTNILYDVTPPTGYAGHFYLNTVARFNLIGTYSYAHIMFQYGAFSKFHLGASDVALDGATFEFTGQTEADFFAPYLLPSFDGSNNLVFVNTVDGTNFNTVTTRSIVAWHWNFGDGVAVVATDPVIDHEYSDEHSGGYNVTVSFEDQNGLLSDTVTLNVVPEVSGRVGALSDEAGSLFTALRAGSNVSVNSFASTTSGPALIATVSNVGNPSLLQIRPKSYEALYLFVQQRAHGAFWTPGDGEWFLWQTKDKGVTWIIMSASAFDSTYKSATACGTLEGAIVAVARLTGSNVIACSRTFDRGTIWELTGSVGTIPDGSSTSVAIVQESASGRSRLIVTNGADFLKVSDDLGETWS